MAEEVDLTVNDFLSKAKPYVERLHEIWLWQNRKGTAYRKEHRPSIVVRRHKCYRYEKIIRSLSLSCSNIRELTFPNINNWELLFQQMETN